MNFEYLRYTKYEMFLFLVFKTISHHTFRTAIFQENFIAKATKQYTPSWYLRLHRVWFPGNGAEHIQGILFYSLRCILHAHI